MQVLHLRARLHTALVQSEGAVLLGCSLTADACIAFQGNAVRQHLCNLKLLQFLIDEMRFESQQPLSAPPTVKLAPARADSSLQARSRSVASPSPSKARALRSLSNSPSKQPATALQESAQPNAAPRDGAVHVPASAPSSSGVNSPSTSPLQRSASLLRSVNRSLLNQQPQPLQQSSHRNSSDLLSENDTPKIPAHRENPHFGRATDRFQDENQPFGRSRPANGRVSADKRFGELDAPAEFVPTGDLNEDADQLLRAQVQPGSSIAICHSLPYLFAYKSQWL